MSNRYGTNPYGDEPTRAYSNSGYPNDYNRDYGQNQNYGQGNYGQAYGGNDRPPRRTRIDTGPFVAGVAATALVAAIAGWVLTAILQALYNRFDWTPVWIYGAGDPWSAAFTGAIVAILSGALMWVLAQGVPSPLTFYSWIAILIAVAAIALPFLTVEDWQAALGAGIVHGVLAAVIISLTDMVASRTVHL